MSEPLSSEIVDELLKAVSLTLSEIVLWRKKIKRLKKEIEKQEVTEDDIIYYDLHRFIREARYEKLLSRTFPIDGDVLRITITHRHGGESVFGVDLVYEISDRKIVLLQYKKSNQGRFFIDRKQLKKLRYFCYDRCFAKKYEGKPWFLKESRIVSLCPSYYYLIIGNKEDELVMPACVVESILDSKSKSRSSAKTDEFLRGFSREAFDEMFSKCWLGAVFTLKESVDHMTDILLSEDHILVQAQERSEPQDENEQPRE